MKNNEFLKEIKGFEKKSNFRNRMTILLYKSLKTINCETGYMTMSLLSTVLSFYVFGFNPVRDNGLVV
jgi:hypothetical protein